MTNPAPGRPRAVWPMALAIYSVLTLVYAWPLLGSMATRLPHDAGDPGLNAWILWWNTRAWPLTAAWWNAPIFFPAHGAFALSETLLSLMPLTTPLQWAGAGPIVAYNIAFLLSFPASALAAHALTRQLTGRHDAGFLAGLAFAFSPYRGAQMPHLQMLWMCWMPLALMALHRYLDKRRPRDLVIAGVCWLLNGLTSGYLLIFFAVLVGVWALFFLRQWRDWAAVALALGVASLPLVPYLVGYQRAQASMGLARNADEIDAFGADLSGVLATAPDVWLPSHWTIEPRAEGELYPGIAIVGIVAAGVWTAWRHRRKGAPNRLRRIAIVTGLALGAVVAVSWAMGGWKTSVAGIEISLQRPLKALFVAVLLVGAPLLWDQRTRDAWRRRSPLFFYVAAAILMLLFALGPTGRAFGTAFFYQAPYSWLMHLPGGHSLRVPARFAALFILCLTQAAALAYCRFVSVREGQPARGLTAALCAAVLLEGWIFVLPTGPAPALTQLERLRPDVPLLELPMGDTYRDTAAMLRSTDHHHVLMNGFSGYEPPHYDMLRWGLAELDPSVLASLQEFGPFLVFVDRPSDENNRLRDWMDQVPGAEPIGRSADGSLYALPARPKPSSHPGTPLAIARLEATEYDTTAAYAIDGDLRTRWEDPADGAPGELRVTLEKPAEISRIELDLGEFTRDFPKKLRASVIAADGTATVVFEGRTGGLAMRGTMIDLRAMPLVIEVPAGVIGQRIVLTLVEEDKSASWSVAELKVFGKTPR